MAAGRSHLVGLREEKEVRLVVPVVGENNGEAGIARTRLCD